MAKNGNIEAKSKEIIETMQQYGIDDAANKERKMREYAQLVEEKRGWANLASTKWMAESWRSMIESMSAATVLEANREIKVADIGAGGGLMAVILAIVCPLWKVTAVEPAGRKAAFMAEAAGRLGLGNLRIANTRAEEVRENDFDAVVTRAAGLLVRTVPLAAVLLRGGGLFVALKGSDVEDEVESAMEVFASHGFARPGITLPSFPAWARDRISLVVARKI